MKIPDDVFETRCQYCFHKSGADNKEIPDDRIFSIKWRKELPCNVMGICRPNKIKGECLNFVPNQIFGICQTCEYDNCFREGYCTNNNQPNKRQLYITRDFAMDSQNEYWKKHIGSTCDNYSVKPSLIDLIKQQAAEGKIPRNFDPETMKFTDTLSANDVAEKWAEIEREEKEARRKAEELKQASIHPVNEQLSIFDL